MDATKISDTEIEVTTKIKISKDELLGQRKNLTDQINWMQAQVQEIDDKLAVLGIKS
jgi:hypothetical protein